MRWGRWVGLLLLALAAGLFAYLNAGERVSLHLGVAVIYRVPFALVVFTAFLLGMIVMFVAGLRHDARVRRALRAGESAAVSPP